MRRTNNFNSGSLICRGIFGYAGQFHASDVRLLDNNVKSPGSGDGSSTAECARNNLSPDTVADFYSTEFPQNLPDLTISPAHLGDMDRDERCLAYELTDGAHHPLDGEQTSQSKRIYGAVFPGRDHYYVDDRYSLNPSAIWRFNAKQSVAGARRVMANTAKTEFLAFMSQYNRSAL